MTVHSELADLSDPLEDETDVPAAVMCARCGRAECSGCSLVPEAFREENPWEEGHRAPLDRLWTTARLTAVDGEKFFGRLKAERVLPALAFATLAELLAIASLATLTLPILWATFPGFVAHLLSEQLGFALLCAFMGIPAAAMVMVALHVLWASGIELGLRAIGERPRAAHALRYALYSCGWDLVTSPAGFVMGWHGVGMVRAAADMRTAMQVPRIATEAFLGTARRIPHLKARRALTVAMFLTGTVVLTGAAVLAVAIVAALI